MEDLLWKKKSTARFRYLMLFLIRLSEVLTVSIIPSLIGFLILYITPKVRVMQTLETISLIAFSVMNVVFWVRYVKHRPKRSEFYIMNGIVYALYIMLSVLAYITSDAYLYTVAFSNVRGFEIFGMSTLKSLIYVHIFSVLLLVLSGEIAHVYYSYRARKAAENGVQEAEIKEVTVMPYKNNKAVTFLDVDEVNLQLEQDIEEAAELIRSVTENTSDKNWDKEMSKGNGETIIESVPEDPDNDVEDEDYVSEAYARKEMAENMNYDSDSLWNEEIYKGNKKILDYDEEDEPETVDCENDDSLWDVDLNDGNMFNVDYDETEDYPITDLDEYDSDNLWGDIKQGR